MADQSQNPETELHKTVRLSERDVRAAQRILSALVGDRPDAALVEHADESERQRVSRDDLVDAARQEFVRRRRRMELFGSGMFGEPAWDMLLALYLLEGDGRLPITRLTESSGAPTSTALRWLDYLEKERLVTREAHPSDKRVMFVGLSDKGRNSLEVYFSDTLTY
jgi:DNA-binding MarR family transcriptional regulator